MNVFELFAKIGLDTSEYDKGLEGAKSRGTGMMSGLANGVGGAITGGLKLAAGAIAGATAAVGAFGLSATKVGAEFDSSMSQVAATLGYTTDDIRNNVNGAGDAFDMLREKAEEAGRSTIFSASESAEGLNILAMSGFDAQQSVAMLDDVLHLAAAGSMDMASAASYVSGTMKGFNDDTKDAQYYADLMAKGATMANTSVQQLGEAMSSGAAGAAAYGQSTESMTVSLLRLAEQGEVGAAAGTALAAAMKNLYTPSDQGAKALAELGVAVYDDTGAARDFNTVVNELEASMQGMTDSEQAAYKQTIFGIQGLDAYNKMIVTSADKQNEWATALSDATGEASKQYNTMTDNLQGDVKGWESALEGFKIAVSQNATGSLRDFVQFGTTGLQKITEAFKSDGLSGAMKVFGDVLSDGLKMVTEKLPDFIKTGADLLGAFATGIAENLPVIGTAFMDIGNILLEKLQGVSEALDNVDWNAMGDTVVTGLTQAFTMNLDFMAVGLEICGKLFEGIVSQAPKMFNAAIEMIKQLTLGIQQNLPSLIEKGAYMLMEFSGNLRENAGKLVDVGLNLIKAIANGLIKSLPTLIKTIPTIVINIAGIINDNAPKLLLTGAQIILNLIAGIVQSIPTLIAEFPKIVTAIFAVIMAVNWINLGGTIIKGIANGARSLASEIPNIMRNIMTRGQNFVKSIDWAHLGQFVINMISNGIRGLINLIPNLLKGIMNTAVNLIKSIDWAAVGKAIIEAIWTGINALGEWLLEQVTGLLSGIASKAWGAIKSKFTGKAANEQPEGEQNLQPNGLNGNFSTFNETALQKVKTENNITNTLNSEMPTGEALVDAFVQALDKYGLTVSVDGREFGRVVRKAVVL